MLHRDISSEELHQVLGKCLDRLRGDTIDKPGIYYEENVSTLE
jgi:hypothetical protein